MTGGVLVVDKPSGPTSFDVVQRVRRLLSASKAGHTGTLDPMATGVLAVCVDDAVKLQRWLAEGDKAYDATIAFGAATDTEDAEGRVVERADASALTAAAIRAAVPALVGDIDQVPPMYSAVRVGGRRLHAAARAGETVERAPRRVRVDALELLGFDPAGAADELARARVAVRCGKGTYVRTLAADLGRAVGVPAHLAALRRTAAGPFTLERAIPLGEAEEWGRRDRALLRARLIPPAEALGSMPAIRLSASQVTDVAHGRAVAVEAPPAAPLLRALAPDGDLVALCEPSPGGVRPVRVFADGASR